MSSRPQSASVDVRSHVLQVALRLFSSQGYFNTSVHDIVREAGVSIGSIYHHFTNKEGIVAALYHDILERMGAEVARIRDSQADVQTQCRALVAFLFQQAEQQPEVMSFVLHARHREFMADEAPICSSRPFEMMREVVRRGQQRGVIRDMDPVIAAACLFGGPIRVIHLYLDGVIQGPLMEQLPAVWQSAWSAVEA